MNYLVCTSGAEQGTRIRLDRKSLSIGRDESNDIPIEEVGASRRHAEISLREGSCFVLRVAEGGDSVSVSAEVDLKVQPAEIRMRLRSGDGRALSAAAVNGKETGVLEKDTLCLPPQTKGRYEIVGNFVRT